MRRTLALLELALPLAACGGSQQHVSLADAAMKSSSVRTVKLDITMSMRANGLAQPLTMTATGVTDNVDHRAAMNIDMSKFAQSFGGTKLNPADWIGQEVADFANGHAVIYMNLPFVTRLIPGHKPWVKMDLNAFGKTAGVDFSQFASFTSNPTQMVDWLRATSGSIANVGTDTIDGVETTHYHAIVDLSKYPNLVPANRRAAMKKSIDAVINLAHVRAIPVDVWVGSDNLVRKLNMKLTETIRGQSLAMAMSMHFHDFGASANITLPPGSETVDLSKLAAKGNTP